MIDLCQDLQEIEEESMSSSQNSSDKVIPRKKQILLNDKKLYNM